MSNFHHHLGEELRAEAISIVQINVGLTCNLECHHCHVSSSPRRKEQMSRDTMNHLLREIEETKPNMVDITGGSPELNPHLPWFIAELATLQQPTQVRTNLTVMLEEGYEEMPALYAQHKVGIVASLPCYLEENVAAQRGSGVYSKSIEVLRTLNTLGYGTELPLTLIFNPGGPSLPPAQKSLEDAYRNYLKEHFDIVFSDLATITNMAIGQFKLDLQKHKKLDSYRQLLKDSFNGDTVKALMCRHQIHVAWDGSLHDCDFNYALKMGLDPSLGQNVNSTSFAEIKKRRIRTDEHCFGCTAGAGSSCGGALV